MKTRAAVLRHEGAQRPYTLSRPLAVEQFELDPPGRGELLVKVRAAGLCHSDLSVIDGSRPRPLPMVLGHEAAGEVVALGEGVSGFAKGDHVVLCFVPSCGACPQCLGGRAALCTPAAQANGQGALLGGGRRLHQGGHYLNHHLGVSGFAEYLVASQKSAIRIDPSLDLRTAALFGCAVLTGMGALLHTAKLRAGQSVLVVGLGGVGLSALLGALASGARQVIAADRDPGKLARAKALGATAVVDSGDPQALARVLALSAGGVDVAADFAGAAQALEFAFAATAKGGVTVTAGLPHPDARFALSPVQLVAEERRLLGSYLGGHVPSLDIPQYIGMYQAGVLPVDKLITHTLTLDEINLGFERLAAGEAIRQVVLFD